MVIWDTESRFQPIAGWNEVLTPGPKTFLKVGIEMARLQASEAREMRAIACHAREVASEQRASGRRQKDRCLKQQARLQVSRLLLTRGSEGGAD